MTDLIHEWLKQQGCMWSASGNCVTVPITSLHALLEQSQKKNNLEFDDLLHELRELNIQALPVGKQIILLKVIIEKIDQFKDVSGQEVKKCHLETINAPSMGKHLRCLVLDDKEIRLKKFRERLVGHMVQTTTTGDQTIQYLKDEQWDFLFLDHDLGGLENVPSGPGTGYEVAQWLVANPDRMPKNIIIHSFNENGRKNIKAILPEAIESPGIWLRL